MEIQGVSLKRLTPFLFCWAAVLGFLLQRAGAIALAFDK